MNHIAYRKALPALAVLLICVLFLICAQAEKSTEAFPDFAQLSDNPFEAIIHPEVEPLPPEVPLEGVWPESVEGFLPVCHSKSTSQKVVALTIDDCNEADNLKEIISIIEKDGGKATIFPIGENVSFLAPTLRDAVSKGFEIENHTMSHSGLYHEDDAEFARQIWQQNYEVSKALGGNYQMHFLRPRGGDNRYDQRTHAYMRRMGYCGIAYWSQDGSHSTAKEIMKKLAPGDILLFHTTDEDVEIIRGLVPKLRSKGYRMVTLNELFGLEDNAVTGPLSEPSVMPAQPYKRISQTLNPGDYLRDVYLMQQKLSELGYLDSAYNGFFGQVTVKALQAFQLSAGLEPDGVCGSDTWNALFDETIW